MAKDKKAKDSIPQRSVHLRLGYLHQAAVYLSDYSKSTLPEDTTNSKSDSHETATNKYCQPSGTQTRSLISQMKGVSRKSVIRIQKEIKRTVCKVCDELLVDGKTSLEKTENRSKNSAKPWADVLVVECQTCGTSKRFPVGLSPLNTRSWTIKPRFPEPDKMVGETSQTKSTTLGKVDKAIL